MVMGSEDGKCFWLETFKWFGDDRFKNCFGLVTDDRDAHSTRCRFLQYVG